MLSRIAATSTRRVAFRSAVGGVRMTSSENAGSVAKSAEFRKKEKAHEDQYVRQKELEELKKLREQLKQVQDQVANLEKKNGQSTSEKK